MRIFEEQAYPDLKEAQAYNKIINLYGFYLHFPAIRKILQLRKEGIILDVGCGGAQTLINIVKRSKMKAVGLDISAAMLSVAKRNIGGQDRNIALVRAEMVFLPFKNVFDLVICLNALHHSSAVLKTIDQMYGVLKSNLAGRKKGIILIYDVIRLPKILQKLCVCVFGVLYTKKMRRQYRDSLRGALSLKEWRDIVNNSVLKGAKISMFLPHHLMLVKEF